MDAPCKIQGNIHVLLCLIHKINVSRILGTYQSYIAFFTLIYSFLSADNADNLMARSAGKRPASIPMITAKINATTDITVSVEEVREEGTTGKMKTVGYRFHLKEKTHEEKQIIMGTWGIPFEDILLLEDGQRPDFKDLEPETDLPFKCD